MKKHLFFPTFVLFLLLVACASPEEKAVQAGLAAFQEAGCAGCHGENGEGNIGPALVGHTREQVFRQVRTPKGDIMPSFPPEKLSDQDVENIVAWIGTLGDEMVMEHAGEETSPELSMTESGHLRLILDAISSENQQDATHHAQHLVDEANPEVKGLAETLLADLQAGELHNVEREISNVLGQQVEEDFNRVAVHLGMAISAAQREDDSDVEHHLESAVEAAANHDHYAEMQSILDDWRSGSDRHGVIDRIYEALGLDHQDN